MTKQKNSRHSRGTPTGVSTAGIRKKKAVKLLTFWTPAVDICLGKIAGVTVFGLFFLAACTSVDTYHNACTDGHDTIAAQVDCVKTNLLQDDLLQTDTLAQEYIRTGDLLVKQVAEGAISEEEAQLKFVQTLNKIKRDELRQHAYEAAIDRYNKDLLPRETQCTQRPDGSINCRTY